MQKISLCRYPKGFGEKLSFQQAVISMLNGRGYLYGKGFYSEHIQEPIISSNRSGWYPNNLRGRVIFPDGSTVSRREIRAEYNNIDPKDTDNILNIDYLLTKIYREGATFERTPVTNSSLTHDGDLMEILTTAMRKKNYDAFFAVMDISLMSKLASLHIASLPYQLYAILKFQASEILIENHFTHPKSFAVECELLLKEELFTPGDIGKFNATKAGLEAAMQQKELSHENLPMQRNITRTILTQKKK